MSPATGVTEEDDDQTGDSGMGTGSGSAQYLMTDFLPGMQLYKHHSHLGKGRGGWNAVCYSVLWSFVYNNMRRIGLYYF